MVIKARRAAENRSQMGLIQNDIQDILDKHHATANFGHGSPKHSPLPANTESPIYFPLPTAVAYSPLPDDDELPADTPEEKDLVEPRSDSRRFYQPPREGIDPKTLQEWPRPAMNVNQMQAQQNKRPAQSKFTCECDCHQPGPRQVGCDYIQKTPKDHPKHTSREVENRIRADTDRWRSMECADCCKAADFDSDFFIIDPEGAIQITLDPTTLGTTVVMQKVRHRLVDEQDQRPSNLAANRQGGRLKPCEGRHRSP